LSTINGIGFTMYGKRDLDVETGTYVKTHVFCLVFIPVFCVGAYRVADAQRGWYFLGKEPLSSFARSCNIGVLCLSLIFGGIVAESAYKSSPEYIAKQQLKKAEAALSSGEALRAAGIYSEMVRSGSAVVEARAGLRNALQQCVTNAIPSKVEGAFKLLAAMKTRGDSPDSFVPDAWKQGMTAIERFRGEPEAALDILGEVRKLGQPTNGAAESLQVELLKSAIAARADNTNRVVELALIFEEREQMPEAIKLLKPYQEKLGATEGARMLGKALLAEGNYEAAYQLLFPYVETRLEKLHAVERNYTNALAAAYGRAMNHLNDGKADQSFYDSYKRGSKPEKEQLVDEFVQKWMRTDQGLQRAVASLKTANQIVHVTLDLGIVQLNRAQALSDPAGRKAELEAAEKTFLAIRGLAGDTDEYRLFLGQVYYWLGRSPEGKALFDQLLAANKRSCGILMSLGRTLREVGETEQARAMLEEAYQNAPGDKERFLAAAFRARVQKDTEDQIAWLEKADSSEPSIQVALNDARGDKALDDGNRELAAKYLRQAIEGHKRLSQDAAELNNFGLAWLSLYRATGNVEDYTRGLNLLEQAVAMSPGHSLLLMNITHLFLTRACMDVVGDAIRYDVLKESPDTTMLMHLYRDEAERTRICERLRQDEYMKKAMGYIDKTLLLAPKDQRLYHLDLHLLSCFHDLAELQKLEQRMRIAAPDSAEANQETLEVYRGEKENERLEKLQREVARYEQLLTLPAVKEHAPTLRFARLRLVDMKMGRAAFGRTVDAGEILAEARALHAQQPNSATLRAVSAASFLRAHEDLKQKLPGYAALADQTRRSVSPRLLMAWLLDQNTDLARGIRTNPLVLQAIQTVKEGQRLFPSSPDIDEYALIRAVDAAEGANLLASLKADAFGRLRDRLQFELAPLAASCILEQYWDRTMAGDKSGAADLYRQAIQQGVPLPPPRQR